MGKILKSKKKTATNFVLLCYLRNIVGQYKKAYLQRTIKILHFLTPMKIQKCLTKLENILAFLTINHLQAESRRYQGIFIYVIPVNIIVLWME